MRKEKKIEVLEEQVEKKEPQTKQADIGGCTHNSLAQQGSETICLLCGGLV